MEVELVLTSCVFGVPHFKYIGERNSLIKWANNVGVEGMRKYWQEKNQVSLNGKETYVLK